MSRGSLAPWDERDRYALGVAVLSAAAVLGGTVWLLRRQVEQGGVLQVRVIHSADAAVHAKLDRIGHVLDAYLPAIQKIADEGVDLHVRSPRRRV